MRLAGAATLAALLLAAPAAAQDALQAGLEGALRGCEAWVLEPGTWVDEQEPFLAEIGLGDRAGRVTEVDELTLPPEPLRLANHYWRINSTPDTGFVLITSDTLPMCHITGGGQSDLQPAVERVLASEDFTARWSSGDERRRGEMISTSYRNVEDPSFTMVMSRAAGPDGRTDRVQMVATAMYELDN
jgi:hypothetical protein